jgi:hypothetical protein
MNYGEVLIRAWQIIWKHKVLWIFGLLSGCASGSTGGSGGSTNYQVGSREFPELERFFNSLTDTQIILGALILIGVVLLLIVIAIVLSTIGRIGLVRGTLQADAGTAQLRFSDLFRGSYPYFWRVFGLNLLFGLMILLVVSLIVGFAVLVGIVTAGIGLICLLPLFCLLIPIGWLVGILIEQANIALVVEDIGIGDAISRGWEVIRTHLGEMILMGLILFLGGGLVGIVLALPFFIAVVPLAWSLFAGTNVGLNGGVWISILCLVLYLPVLLVLSGMLRAYIGSAWTLNYLRLTGRTPITEEPLSPVSQPAI